jgi:hypothetical protein
MNRLQFSITLTLAILAALAAQALQPAGVGWAGAPGQTIPTAPPPLPTQAPTASPKQDEPPAATATRAPFNIPAASSTATPTRAASTKVESSGVSTLTATPTATRAVDIPTAVPGNQTIQIPLIAAGGGEPKKPGGEPSLLALIAMLVGGALVVTGVIWLVKGKWKK